MKFFLKNIFPNIHKIALKDVIKFFSITIICITFDLYTKHIVFNADFFILKVCSVFNIVKVENYGISFGLLSGSSFWVKRVIIIFNVIISVCLFYLLSLKKEYKKPNAFLFAISIIVGGAIGNVIDRVKFGYVRDFLDFHILDKHWPAFNIADGCICIGVGLWVILELFKIKNIDKQKIISN